MRMGFWRMTVIGVSTLMGLMAAGAAGYLQLSQGTDPVFKPQGNSRATAVGIITFVAVGSTFARAVRQVIWHRSDVRGRKIAASLRGLNKTVAKVVQVEKQADKLGASAYILYGWGRFSFLRRIEHERVADLPGISMILWWGAKGVTGRCCREGKEQVHDAGDWAARYGTCTKREWKQLDRDTRMGLSYRDWQRIKDKYGTVVAVPVFQKTRVVGCVVLDAPTGLHQDLLDAEVTEAVAAAATLIADQLA